MASGRNQFAWNLMRGMPGKPGKPANFSVSLGPPPSGRLQLPVVGCKATRSWSPSQAHCDHAGCHYAPRYWSKCLKIAISLGTESTLGKVQLRIDVCPHLQYRAFWQTSHELPVLMSHASTRAVFRTLAKGQCKSYVHSVASWRG